MKWLKESGLKVDESKTEPCLFHRLDCQKITMTINKKHINSIDAMNILGVAFDFKLNWYKHVNNSLKKAKKALHAIKLIKPHFTPKELCQIITSNFIAIVCYNSEIWHLPKLNSQVKLQLYRASASALKLCTPNYNWSMSHCELHTINKRATPEKFIKYKRVLQLF
jgi:hypothetical protein